MWSVALPELSLPQNSGFVARVLTAMNLTLEMHSVHCGESIVHVQVRDQLRL